MTTQEIMGLRIKSLREERNMSQSQLAEKVGYKDKTAVAKVEAGKVDLPQSKISAFAKALNTTTSYLFGNIEQKDYLIYNEENKAIDGIVINSLTVPKYYQDQRAAEMADFLMHHPEYQVLFDASRKVKPDDIEKALTALGLFSE